MKKLKDKIVLICVLAHFHNSISVISVFFCLFCLYYYSEIVE